jgi:hypothetical protein
VEREPRLLITGDDHLVVSFRPTGQFVHLKQRPIFASALRSVDVCTVGAVCDRVKVAEVISLLRRPVYTYSQVDRLLGLTSGTARRWINGYRHGRRTYEPIIRPESRNTTWVTWGEYVEARLLANWRDLDKLPIPKLRRLAGAAVCGPSRGPCGGGGYRSDRVDARGRAPLEAATIAELVAAGESHEDVAERYDLSAEQIDQAVGYYRHHLRIA